MVTFRAYIIHSFGGTSTEVMAPIYAGVFFTRTKTSGVVRSKDLLGKVEVGHVLKARWNGRVYAAKVHFVRFL